MLKKILYQSFLPILINKACESRIPRSGKAGAQVNCYTTLIDHDNSPHFVATGYTKGKLTGLKWDGQSFATDYSIDISDIDKFNFQIVHYYGLSNIRYNSIYDFAWNYITKFVYIKIHLFRAISFISQYFFNFKKLVTKKRMELLQFMLNNQLDRDQDVISIIDLMTKLYTIKWILHPSGKDQQRKLEIYLDSLVESGEIRKVQNGYVVTGKAISTIERYEEEERRHVAAVKLQRKMIYLTLILVFVGLVQSGLIKLPPLLDFSDDPKTIQTIE